MPCTLINNSGKHKLFMQLNYRSYGTGEPLIILHGLFGMLDNWHSIAKKLSSDFEVFTIDQRNHGQSPHSEEHTYALMARDLYDFLEEQNLFSVNILGHSMGGKTAMQFAALFPGFVKSLVIADMFPKTYNRILPDHQIIFKVLEKIEGCNFKSRKDAEDYLKNQISDERIFLFMAKNLKINTEGCPGWKFNAKTLLDAYPKLMQNVEIRTQLKLPALFIKGGKSDYIMDEDFQNINQYFPNAKLVVMPEASHWLHADNPGLFCEIVLDFLKHPAK